jgi:hypothetical protein
MLSQHIPTFGVLANKTNQCISRMYFGFKIHLSPTEKSLNKSWVGNFAAADLQCLAYFCYRTGTSGSFTKVFQFLTFYNLVSMSPVRGFSDEQNPKIN